MYFKNLCNKWWWKCFSKRKFLGKLNEVIFEKLNSKEIVVAGDFNSRTGRNK
jgi:hypothetical protein